MPDVKSAFRARLLSFLILVGVTGRGLAQDSNPIESLAILRGVETARSEIQSLRAELLLSYKDSLKTSVFHLFVEQQGIDRRVEHLSDSVEPSVYLIQNDVVSSYIRQDGEDLQIYGIHRSSSIRGDMAFDPRLIGLSDTLSVDTSVMQSLWINNFESATTLPDEIIDSVSCRRIQVKNRGNISDLWVDDRSFRVYRRSVAYPGGSIHLDSDFQDLSQDYTLPVSVTGKRVEGDTVREMILTVKSLEVNVPIPPERFTIQSFNLPINTMRNDYRISRITGYWNGLEFTENPVPADRLPPPAPSKPTTVAVVPRSRFWMIVVNAVALVGLAGFAWWRIRARTP